MTADHPEASVLTERRGRVLIVTLNRPGQRNAVNMAVAQGLGAAMEVLEASADLTVGVLTGAGKGFSAGMDLKALLRGELAVTERGFAGITEKPPIKPLVAAVEGFALAGGLEIVLACDLLVAAKGAKLGIPEVKRSLIASSGGLLRLPRVLPRNIAMELALKGEPISAERGYELGLVNEICEPGRALSAALDIADQIAENGPLALVGSKRILAESVDWPESDFWGKQAEIVAPVAASDDAREGAEAFAQKRTPRWSGH